MIANAKLTSCFSYMDNDGKYYLHLTYEYDDEEGTHEVIFPKAELPITYNTIPVVSWFNGSDEETSIELISNRMRLSSQETDFSDGKPVYYVVRIKNPKIHEMTIEDIEKKLGYKIKIVKSEKTKRIDTFSEEVDRAFKRTLNDAFKDGTSSFSCGTLRCSECPLNKEDHLVRKSYEEWIAWSEEEV